MLVADIIRHKRDGAELTPEEIDFFVAGLADERIPAEQVSALAMAICLNSMTAAECANLTSAMARSGTVLDWADASLDGPVVDKHSTGGVGDKVSFLLAPIAAACGLYVPMISGRGLGHTGGTTDKIESIPGYDATPGFDHFRRVVRETGCAIIGQTKDLAPADRRLYAIRDVTATVESVPLITASILSKKIAAGLDALVMDVKVGNGAFMPTLDAARGLAGSIVSVANAAGLPTRALISDMNECLGKTAGNALEIAESVRFLRDEESDSRLAEVVYALVAEMLVAGGLASNLDQAVASAKSAVSTGKAASTFGRMVSEMGGPTDFVARFDSYLAKAAVVRPVVPQRHGRLHSVDTVAVGNAIIELGGGRRQLNDELDLSVGFSDVARIGDSVDGERPLALVHAKSADDADAAAARLQAACEVGDTAPPERPVIVEALRPD
jgi:thymidine phosphorylase